MASRAMHLTTLVTVALLLSTLSVNALRLAFLSSGADSELQQLAAVIQAARQRHHTAALFVDAAHLDRCSDLFKKLLCVPVLCHHNACLHDTAPLRSALRAHSFSPDLFLAASFLREVDQLSAQLGVPAVVLALSAADVPSSGYASLQHLPHALGSHHPWLETVWSAARGFSATARDFIGLGNPVDHRRAHHVVTQGIPGVDIVGPLCPHVHPIGFFRAENALQDVKDTAGLRSWLTSCRQRFIYTNLPVENSVRGHQFIEALNVVSNYTSSCVLWYAPSGEPSWARLKKPLDTQRIKITGDVAAAPLSAIWRHTPLLVLTDSVKEVLYEALLAESPIVTVASDRFSCSQVLHAGVGACAASPTAADVLVAARSVYNSSAVRERVRRARRMGYLLGGAEKAVELAELIAFLGPHNLDFACDQSILRSPYGYDAVMAGLLSVFLGTWLSLFLGCCRVCRLQRKVAADSRHTQR